MKELKSCPFCGNEPEVLRTNDTSKSCIIRCDFCWIKIDRVFTSKEEAIKVWNTRADGWISVDKNKDKC